MKSNKLEKILLVLLAVCAVISLGLYLNRNKVKDELVFHNSGEEVATIKVSISGEVVRPGDYVVKKDSRLQDVIYAAGGVTGIADIKKLDADTRLMDGMTIEVPAVADNRIPKVVPVVNINTADAKTLCLIPGVGEVIAGRIIKYREENGKFNDISEIMNVNGIGEKTFARIKDFIKTEET